MVFVASCKMVASFCSHSRWKIEESTGENTPSGNSEGAIIYANRLLA